MKIVTLGPAGTFSHEAVLKLDKNADILFKETIWDVFDSVRRNEVERGIVPIENSVSGSVGLSLDALMEFDLVINREIIVPVRHNLASGGELREIKKVFANPESYAQCEKFMRDKLRNVEIIAVASNAKAAEELSKNNSKVYGGIVPELAMKKYKLRCLARGIQDSRFNVTRFVVLTKKMAEKTGSDRTSIAIYPHMDKPGLLYKLIGQFAKRKINLTRIESRPSKGRLGDYIFFIDLQGHEEDSNVKAAFEEIEENFFVKKMGSYPREY